MFVESEAKNRNNDSKHFSMEEVLLRFSHLGERIFDLMDNKNLVNCRKVSQTWNSFIEDLKFPWIRIIKKHDENYIKYQIMTSYHIKSQLKWKKMFQKTSVEDLREFAKRLLCPFPDISYTFRFHSGMSLFHSACKHGHLKILKVEMMTSVEFHVKAGKQFFSNSGFTSKTPQIGIG